MEMHSPELKPRRSAGRRGVQGQQKGPLAGKEDENQAWLAMLEKATNSVRYISQHIKKEHFIRGVSAVFLEFGFRGFVWSKKRVFLRKPGAGG